jgi:ribonuclease HI
MRKIIYVDAGQIEIKGKQFFQICLYDSFTNGTDILKLNSIEDNNVAEKYAILYAIMYLIKKNYTNSHILSDNQSACKDKIILKLIQDYKINLSWIPREINIVADKCAKLNSTVKESEFFLLNFLYTNIYN